MPDEEITPVIIRWGLNVLFASGHRSVLVLSPKQADDIINRSAGSTRFAIINSDGSRTVIRWAHVAMHTLTPIYGIPDMDGEE